MVRIFGHYFSLRAIVMALIETLAFVVIYSLVKLTVTYFVFGRSAELYDEEYFLPIFCLVAWATGAACGLYNKEMFSDAGQSVERLLMASIFIYFLIAIVVSVAELLLRKTANLKLYYAIMLGTSMIYFITLALFRVKIFRHNFNGTVLERRILVLGTDECAAKIEHLNGHSRSPYKAVAFIPINQEQKNPALTAGKVLPASILETPKGLVDLAHAQSIDEIVVASRERRGVPLGALMECKLAGMTISDFSSFWERQTGQIDLDEVSPHWLIFSGGFRVTWLRDLTKRVFDIVIATILLGLALPIIVFAAIAVKLDSPGPIFYRQERVGAGGKLFQILKFRSMRTDAEKDGVARWAATTDSRVTRFGHFIRRTRIDEIPQAINVLLGHMSFVGPRPERPAFVQDLSRKIPYYDIRHRLKPGITGWAQINYPYGATDADAKAKLTYDLYYVKNWNLFLDALILFQTTRVILWREGAR